jgi:hypothetical protein
MVLALIQRVCLLSELTGHHVSPICFAPSRLIHDTRHIHYTGKTISRSTTIGSGFILSINLLQVLSLLPVLN